MGSSASTKRRNTAADLKPASSASSVKAPASARPSPKPAASSPALSSGAKGGSSSSNKRGKKTEKDEGFSAKAAEDFFNRYADNDDGDVIGPEGMTRLCADWGVEPEDVVLLVISFFMGAAEQGYWTRDEFLAGMRKMEIDSLARLKAKTPELRARLSDASIFKELYRFSFTFAKEHDKKIVDLDTAVLILQMVLPPATPHLATFVEFLGHQQSYRALNMDQWMSFLEWTRTVDDDLGNYDTDSAWPVMLDEYSEWLATERLGTKKQQQL